MKRQPSRLNRLELPNRVLGKSAPYEDLDLLSVAPENFLDTIHFDTVRFSHPSCAVSVFEHAAKDEPLAYTPYHGNAVVLNVLGDSLHR